MFILLVSLFQLAPSVNFSQSTYGIDEDKGPLQLMLILSNPSTTNITIRVFSNDGSATGEKCIIHRDAFNSCNMGMSGLPDKYTRGLRMYVHIRQTKSAHVTTIM